MIKNGSAGKRIRLYPPARPIIKNNKINGNTLKNKQTGDLKPNFNKNIKDKTKQAKTPNKIKTKNSISR